MKAIIYTSNTGSTAEYAQLLGKELNVPVHSLQQAKNKVPAGSEIIYLGWIMAGGKTDETLFWKYGNNSYNTYDCIAGYIGAAIIIIAAIATPIAKSQQMCEIWFYVMSGGVMLKIVVMEIARIIQMF